MPNGQQEGAKSILTQQGQAPTGGLDQELEHRGYIVDKLRNKRGEIGKMPVDKQLSVYGIAFDREIAPMLTRSGLSAEDMDKAKDNWIIGIVSPGKQHQLGEDFGVDKPASARAPFSAFVGGTLAGAAGAAGSFADWITAGRKGVPDPITGKPQDIKSPIRGQLSEAERVNWELAVSGGEKQARLGAGVGKAIPATAAFIAGEGAIPAVAKGTPMAWRALQYLSRMGTGTAASTVPFEKTSAGDVAKQTAYNVVFDALLHGAGKSGSKGLSYLVSKARGSAKPGVAAAANAVDELFGSVAKEKFPGKPIDQLTAAEFDSVYKEASAKREAARQTAKEAEKAVRDAKAAEAKAAKPTPATPEAKALSKAQRAEQAKAERATRSEKEKHVAKQLAEYKKRVGALPGGETEHFKRISAGETVEQIFGPTPEAKATQAATQVGTEAQAAILKEGAPTAVEAVKTVQQLAKEIGDLREQAGLPRTVSSADFPSLEILRGKGLPGLPERRIGPRKGIEYRVPQIGTPGKPGITIPKTEGEQLAETMRKAQAEATPKRESEGPARQFIASDPARKAAFEEAVRVGDERAQGNMILAAQRELEKAAKPKPDVKAKIAKTAEAKAKPSLFTTDLSKITGAKTPEEAIAAKKDATASVITKAQELIKATKDTTEQMNIAAEVKKEIARINTTAGLEVSSKKVRAVGKAAAKKQGMEALTTEIAEASKVAGASMVNEVEKSIELTKWFKDNKHDTVLAKVRKEYAELGIKDIPSFNEMLEAAKAELTPKVE